MKRRDNVLKLPVLNRSDILSRRFPAGYASLLPAMIAAAAMGASEAVHAQTTASLEEVIVSARRQQESAQDVPISMTVFSQEQLNNKNIFSGPDLATYTPSLAVNNRFGPDQATFAIRGFTQELRTTASVGFYFAEVVAPRGGGSVTAGDGAGPGSFFDLQDVLVLKGPQGTLFGRNTTGGAILLTPQEPTTNLEGYLEASAGNYDMQRLQGVLNVPLGDRVRARFGVDTQQRDGYLNNVSGIGPSELADVDYIAGRASVMVDVTETIQNYTIASYSDSENNGALSGVFACNPSPQSLLGFWCPGLLERQGTDLYDVDNPVANPVSELKQWQVINTTTWQATDDLTIRNILSYADLEQTNRTSLWGTNFDYFGMGRWSYTDVDIAPGYPTNSQTSFVEELQFQGYAFDSRLTWQAGLYFENSKPDGWSSTQSINQLFCQQVDVANPGSSRCVDVTRALAALGGGDPIGDLFGPGGYGAISRQLGKVEYTNQAVYGEATYELNDQFKLTGGLRYTHDETEGEAQFQVWNGYPWQAFAPPTVPIALPGPAGTTRCAYESASLAGRCGDQLDQTSEAWTGLINLDYFPMPDVMLYAKYSRGYRQGSVNLFGGEGFRKFDPEEVDTYEVGAKTTLRGPVPGTFNVALFYNDLKEQQLQYGTIAAGVPPSTAIVNAGKSMIQGAEIESTLLLTDNLQLNLSYTWLDTELKKVENIESTATVTVLPSSLEGGDLTFSPNHSLVVGLTYFVPLPETVGDVAVAATYTFTDEQYTSAPEYQSPRGLSGSPYALVDSYELLNLNLNWNRIAGSNFDAALFVTNALDEEYVNYVTGAYHSLGLELRVPGQPRMWGARLRYTFGQ